MIAALSLPFMKGTNASSGLGQIFTGVYKGLCEAFGIASPAKNMMPIGGYIIAGMFSGITNALTNIKEWLKTNVFNKIHSAWDSMKELKIEVIGKFKEDAKNKAAALKKKISSIKGKTATVWGKFKENAKNKASKLKEKIKGVKGKTVDITARFKDAITGVLNSLIAKINTLIGKLRSIKIASYQPFKDIKNIPKLAKGGIVNNPGRGVHTIVGEKGPEAVIPLNDTVLGKIASMITANQSDKGKSVIIPVYLDGRMIAKYTVDTMARQSFELNKGGAY